MRYAWRGLLVTAVFLAVGFTVMHLVIAHAGAMNTPGTQVRLAGGMAGLFAGGAAACLVGIAMLLARRRA